MQYNKRNENGFSIIALEGDVDFHSSREARQVLLEIVKEKGDMLIDMSKVEYIDSSGIACLVEAFQESKTAGTKFGLVSVQGTARRVLELARLEQIFPIYSSISEVEAS